MSTSKRFLAKNGLDNNNNTIANVADPVNAQDVATKAFSSNASNLTGGTIPNARMPSILSVSTLSNGIMYSRGLNVYLGNSDAAAGNRALLTIPAVGSGFNAIIRVETNRPSNDVSSSQRAMLTFKVTRGGGATGSFAFFSVESAEDDHSSGFSPYQWYFDNTTGAAYLRFGQSGNSFTWTVNIEADGNSASALTPTLTIDTGSAPSGTAIYPVRTATNQGGNNFAVLIGGSEKFRIDSSGNLGIGISPSFKLDISSTLSGTTVASNALVNIESQASGRDSHIRFGDTVNAAARFGYLSGALYAYVNAAERMRITTAGYLLLNATTATGTDLLQVKGSASVANSGVDGTYADALTSYYNSNMIEKNIIRSAVSTTASGSGYSFNVSDGGGLATTTEILRINRDAVRILSGSGDAKLNITAATTGNPTFQLQNATSGALADIYANNSKELVIRTNGVTEAIRVSSSGKLGVGATSPQALVHAKSTSVGASIYIDAFTGNDATLNFLNNGTEKSVVRGDGTGNLRFEANGAERVRIDNSGQFGIGFTSVSAKFQTRTNTNTGLEIDAGVSGDDSRLLSYDRTANLPKTLALDASSITLKTSSSAGGGTTRFSIDSIGRVAIGNAGAASSPLMVTGSASIDTTGSTGAYVARFRDTTTAAQGVGGGVLFQGLKSSAGAVGNYASIAGVKENATDNNEQGAFIICTTPSSGVLAERVRVTSGGNVLIGSTTDSGYKLYVNGGNVRFSGTTLSHFLDSSDGSGVSTTYMLSGTSKGQIGIAGGTGGISSGSVLGDMVVRVNGNKFVVSTDSGSSAAMTISAAGMLAVGGTPQAGVPITISTSFQNAIDIRSSNAQGAFISFANTSTSQGNVVGHYKAASGGGTALNADALLLRSVNGIGFAPASGTVAWQINTSSHMLPIADASYDVGSISNRVRAVYAGFYRFATTTQSILNGPGSPEGVVTASVGSMYLRNDGGAGTTLYIKESGTGNTGWVAK